MQCKELEAVLEQEGLSPLPADARQHLAACAACQDFLADISAVVVAAKRIPAEVEPPDRVWISLRAQLEAEGIIRDQQLVVVPSPAPWWQGLSHLFRPRMLASVGAGVLVILGGIYMGQRHPATPTRMAKTVQPVPTQAQVSETVKSVVPPPALRNPVASPRNSVPPVLSAGTRKAPQPRKSTDELQPSPSEDAYLGGIAVGLNQTEGAVPRRELANNAAVDASLRENLRTLNEFIAECEARLKQNPQDQLTREYLNMAYQQKAELLTAMMDSGRSEH